MMYRKNRRRRRSKGLSLLSMLAILLVGVLLAAALSPHRTQTGSAADTQAEQLANQLADSVTPDTTLVPPIQKGSIPAEPG